MPADAPALQKRAGAGDVRASFLMGAYHGTGSVWHSGIPKDEVKATEFYRAASDGGDAEAAYCLGMCYHSGSGVAKDEAKALEQYLRAASQGHLEAQKSLVVCYAMGYGCREADQAKAMRYCRLAAENGDPEMMYQVAARLEAGNGSARDTDRAQHFYRKAAAAGHQGAAQLLAANAKSEFVLTRPFGTTPGW